MNAKSGFKALPLGARAAIILASLAGASTATFAMASQLTWNLPITMILLIIAITTARAKVTLTGSSTLSLLTATVLFSLMAAGTGTAVLVGICGVIVQTFAPRKKLIVHQFVFNVGMMAVTVLISGWVYESTISARAGFPVNLIAIMLAALVYFLGNSAFVAAIIALSNRTSMLRIWIDHFAPTAPSFLIAGLLSLLTTQFVANPSLVAMIVPLLYAVYYSAIRVARQSRA